MIQDCPTTISHLALTSGHLGPCLSHLKLKELITLILKENVSLLEISISVPLPLLLYNKNKQKFNLLLWGFINNLAMMLGKYLEEYE